MTLYYVLMLTIVALVIYAGYDNTMRLVAYADIEVRWHWVVFRSYFLRRQLEKELGIHPTSFREHYQSYGKR
jgi:hypothetical protein